MAKIDRLTPDKLAKAAEKAKKKPKEIGHPLDLILELIRWEVRPATLQDVLAEVTAADELQTANAIIQQSESKLGFSLEVSGLAVWAEIDPAALDDPIPAAWGAPPVDDEDADPPTSRPRKWSEVRMLIERGNGRYFCPCSDGVDYFAVSKLKQIQNAAGILRMIDASRLQNAPD